MFRLVATLLGSFVILDEETMKKASNNVDIIEAETDEESYFSGYEERWCKEYQGEMFGEEEDDDEENFVDRANSKLLKMRWKMEKVPKKAK
ncbi:hypothetical protein RIF29_15887 [Crotalaria pallida]|uniref:Uncharacterized protein n=1 Tax=Crotalaria pallida TaxID=3830 RepID=A0AAN9FMN8_CROPI